MTALATLPVVLGTGIHSARPAAADVGSGGIYSCTTHSLIYQTDGSTWTTWATLGGTAASFHGCYVHRTTDQTGVADSTPTGVAFNAADIFDTDAFHDTSTTNTRLIIPSSMAGKYLVTASVVWDTNSTNIRQFWFAHTGSGSTQSLLNGLVRANATVSYLTQTATAVLDMAVADYVEVMAFQDSGNNRTLSGSVIPISAQLVYLGA